MSAEIHRARRGRARHTYFVGRRPYEAPEIYAVTEDDVRRLRPGRRHGPLTRIEAPVTFDWHAADARALELSHVLLTSVAGGHRPRRELEERFVLDVLAALPDDGFVLASDAILRWLDEARGPRDSPQLEPPPWSRLQRLRGVFRRKTKAPITDG